MKNKKFILGIAASLGAYVIWGFSFMASKVCQGHTSPFVLLAYRFDIALLLLSIPLLTGKRKLQLKGKNILPLLLLGTCEPCLYFIGEQYGLRYTNSSFSGVMIAVIPIVTLLLAAVFLKDRPGKAQWAFSLLSIAGIIVITLSEKNEGELTFAGVMFLLLAVIAGASYTVVSRGISDSFSVFERTYFVQLMGGVFFTALALIENRADPAAIITPLNNGDFILAVLYLAVMASVVSYTLYNYAVSNAPVANVVSFCNLTTVISVAAGVVFFDEPFSALSAAAIVAVLAGIWGVQKYSPQNGTETT